MFSRRIRQWCLWFLLGLAVMPAARPGAQTGAPSYKFDFGPGKVAAGYTQVLPTTVYTRALGYGFEPGATVKGVERAHRDALRGDFITGDQPFYFSVALPAGNYDVTVTLGDAQEAADATLKAELRRLLAERIPTAAGKFETRTFTVNVRTPAIAGGGEVALKERERTTEAWAWDEKLTLEFNGPRPAVCAVEITPAPNAPTVYLLGDSTVADQPREPYNSWGQMLPRFFKPGVAVANHAESGESLKSSLGARRLDKVLSLIKPGDWLFIQYGHNDQKEKGEGVGAFTTYKADLQRFVAAARERGATPVLVTSMHRRSFEAVGKITNSLGDYPAAVRQVAQAENVPLIDLHALSQLFYEALGVEKSMLAFKPGDNTHHNNYGSYQLARCIVASIKANKLGLTKWLDGKVPAFDPARPDPVETWTLPASPTPIDAPIAPIAPIADVPASLTGAEFARLSRELSEEGGYFRSDNFTSNETAYLTVVDKLKQLGATGGAYVGVGPEQNFTYIAKIRPRLAIIVDIRRQAVIQHLMYKAIFHLSANRTQFLARLFSRALPKDPKDKPPAANAPIGEILTFIGGLASDEQTYAANLATLRQTIEEDFQFKLADEDKASLDYVYKNFRMQGLEIAYRMDGGGGYFPGFKDLLLQTDLNGKLGNFLAVPEDFEFVRELHRKNLIIPVVGDFSGQKALRAVGDYLRKQGLTVTAFYTSNVEQYLFQNNVFTGFVENVRRLPLTDKSLFIRSATGRFAHPARLPNHRATTLLQLMKVFVQDFDAGLYQSYSDLCTTNYIAP